MAISNVFVKLLNGKTVTLKFSDDTVSGEAIKSSLYDLTRIPPQHQRLITGSQQIYDKTLIKVSNGEFFTINLLLRLLGGKGGFGSLLRGAATKAGQKKTNNFDACRDMSGRRLRHVNAEKKLQEWKDDAEERKLEKMAEDFIKKKAKAVKKSGSGESEKYIAKYREDSEKCMEDVEASVRDSFLRSEDAKRKILPSSGSNSKRLKLWTLNEKDEESDSDEDEEDDDEKSVVLDDVNHVRRSKDGEGSSGSVPEAQPSEGESLSGGSTQSDLEVENGTVNLDSFVVGEGSGSGGKDVESTGLVEPKLVIHDEMVSETVAVPAEESVTLKVDSGACKDTVGQSANNSSLVPVEGSGTKEIVGSVAITAIESSSTSKSEKPLNFDDYNSAEDMEVLGMEGLKAELQAHGLKCGGTLQERAARLFLLKTTPLEKLPKKLVAKK
ncbi:Replication stress response regulator sde2 [Thalictrum thalictroides]|uniref:Replication stress response regulator sde2 n=1 Tax=Thalictrum thalictroides TaxID=46969 RepID=A0A7J6XFR8_THATH|nr:Replication stress response regulator sde2 [Thalictrum thalictroides]